ncbi:hypothetical protein [Corynebacterium timonense]|uniref:Uncharacterized membrane protein YkvI n=1 Tax=Corynebacterium timonense TaxID=441500 RepID=A0A1H1TPB2_9CORY|nr:hypothetical protein [Corynebacterium timonense]SDS61776.1 Uncharacterized membrane protein YkvI [Corynebacterium timonense]
MLRNAIGISFAFLGVLVGAGFASGQEAMQYFVAFGTLGFWGAILGAILMLIGGISVLELGSYFQAREHMEVLGRISGTVVSWILDIATIITLFSIGFVMFAGAGSNLNQQFDLPVWVGAFLMLALVMGVGMLDVDKVTSAIGILTPFLLVFVIAGCTWTIVNASPDWSSLNQAAEQVSTTLPNWWVSALNYTGLNFICVTSMAIVIGGNYLDPRAAGIGGALGGLGYLVMLLLLCGALLVSVDTVAGQDMPTLTLISAINPTLGLIMSLIIFGMIFATALGMFYALGKRLSRGRPEKFRVIFISACLLGFVLSFAGFQNLVSYVYPVLGYMGLVLIVVVSFAWLRGGSYLRQEGNRRRRALELTRIKLDPRLRFTKKNQDELAVITASSNVADANFIEAVEDEVGQELIKDDDVDFDPEDPGGEVVYVSYSDPSGPEEHVTAAQDLAEDHEETPGENKK